MSGRGGESGDIAGGQRAAQEALEIIGQMRRRLPMASNWFRTIHRVHRYYEKIINDFNDNSRLLIESSALPNGLPHRSLTLREGGPGGGVEGFKLLEKTLKEFGSIEDETSEHMPRSRNLSGSSNTGDFPRPTSTESRPAEAWTAINSIVNPTPSEPHTSSASTPGYAGHRYPDSSSTIQGLRPSQTPPTNPSPLVSPYPRPPSAASSYTEHPYPHSPHMREYMGQGTQLPPMQHSPPQSNQVLTYHPHLPHYPPPRQLASLFNPSTSPQPSPYPSHSYASSHAQQSQSPRPPWLSSLHKPLGGDDVAAFVDGRSCEEWATAAKERASAMKKGEVFGCGSGVVEGWLWDVWGSARTGRVSVGG